MTSFEDRWGDVLGRVFDDPDWRPPPPPAPPSTARDVLRVARRLGLMTRHLTIVFPPDEQIDETVWRERLEEAFPQIAWTFMRSQFVDAGTVLVLDQDALDEPLIDGPLVSLERRPGISQYLSALLDDMRQEGAERNFRRITDSGRGEP